MGTAKVLLNPTKWFSKAGLKLGLPRGAGRSLSLSKSSTSSTTTSATTTPTLTSPTGSVTSSPMKNTSSLITNKEEELRQVFNHFDGDGDGKVSALELRSYFGSVGEYLSHEDAQAVIDELDSDGDSMLDVHDFMRLMSMELPSSSPSGSGRSGRSNVSGGGDDEEDVRRAFEMYEMEKGSGCITPRSLQRMLGRLGDDRSFEECVAMIHAYDTDGNGVLDFHEFHQMMA